MGDLSAIISLDTTSNIIHVEPGATVGEVTDYLLNRQMQLECCLEMEDATLGGLAMAQGMTTHSHVCGLLSETVVEYEVVSATGDVVVATADNEHAQLFQALPLSHGTLGLLVSLKLRVVPAKAWVELKYTACTSQDALHCKYTAVLEQARTGHEQTPFFVEAIAFSFDTAVLMEGNLVDASEVTSAQVNNIGWWFKPWFFEHVRTMLNLPPPPPAASTSVEGEEVEVYASCTEYIPIRDYLMRHDRSMCMTMATVIPYGNSCWFRYLLGWLLPPQMSFLKSSHTSETREASIRKQCYQDLAFPAEKLPEALHMSDKLFGVYPLLVYPCMVRRGAGGMLPVAPSSHEGNKRMNLNLGIYGVPPALEAAVAAGDQGYVFPMIHRVRELEAWLRDVRGFQHTYCDSMQTEEEFEKMFDHGLYRTMREKYGADKVFPTVYAKTRPEMDIFEWIEEEKEHGAGAGEGETQPLTV
jgi:delta24-sterol reductase